MERERQILMVAPSAVPGGMEDILFNLAALMPSVGMTARVICLQPGPLVERLAEQGTAVDVIEAGRLRDLARALGTSRRIAGVMRAGPFDAVISNMPKAHLYAAPPAARQRVPALWIQAGYPDPPHWMDRLASTLPAAAVIALSRDAADAQQRVSRRRRIRLMHPGINLGRFHLGNDPELRAQHGIPLDRTLVSLVGRLQPWKGQREFLQAARVLADSHPTTRFAIVGGAILGWEGNYPEELKQLAGALQLSERVTFTGHTDEVSRWMRASDIVVNASQPEPFGLVVVEAMAAGCAVVAVATGGPRDIIEDGRSGLLCATKEPAMLAAAIRRLLDDRQLRTELGQAARRRVEADFSREAMVSRFSAIVREAIEAQQ